MAFAQAWTGVQHNGDTAVLTTGALTTTSGNTIVVGVTDSFLTPGATAVTDSKGNTYTRATTAQNGAGDIIAVYYSANITGGASHTVTFDPTVLSQGFCVLTAVELNNMQTASFDIATTNTGTGTTTFASGTATTTATDDLIGYFVVSSGSNAAWTNNGNGTVRSSIGNAVAGTIGGLYTRNAIAAGSNNVTGGFNSETGAYSGIFASFKNTGGAVTRAPGAGSEAMTGQTLAMAFGINMPDVP